MSREHAYAYEAGYRDGSIHYELEHCPACKNVADLQEALAENAKLRKYVAWLEKWALDHASFGLSAEVQFELDMKRRELGIEVDE